MLVHCRRETQSSIQDLRSIALERLGLAGALQEVLQPIAKDAGIDLAFEVCGDSFKVSGAVGNHLLRISQAAVSNAVKHSGCSHIGVVLKYERDSLELSITDDGSGFDLNEKMGQGHFGLLGMQERANKLRGQLTIVTAPGEGTVVDIQVPKSSTIGKTA